jgi:AcrR family transcriptional regulator
MPNSDPRFLRSRTLFRHALVELALGGPEKISISDLCTRTGLERGTFYRHFRDLDELIADTIGDLADQRLDARRDGTAATEIFTEYLKHITEHWSLYRWALWQQRSGTTFIALHERMRSGTVMGFDELPIGDDRRDNDLLAAFAAGGVLGGILDWLRDDEPKLDAATLARWLLQAAGLQRSDPGSPLSGTIITENH